jgi:hypothetical protein
MSARRRIMLTVDDPLAPTPGTAAPAAIAEDTDDVEAVRASRAQNAATTKASASRQAVAPGSGGKRARTGRYSWATSVRPEQRRDRRPTAAKGRR